MNWEGEGEDGGSGAGQDDQGWPTAACEGFRLHKTALSWLCPRSSSVWQFARTQQEQHLSWKIFFCLSENHFLGFETKEYCHCSSGKITYEKWIYSDLALISSYLNTKPPDLPPLTSNGPKILTKNSTSQQEVNLQHTANVDSKVLTQ